MKRNLELKNKVSDVQQVIKRVKPKEERNRFGKEGGDTTVKRSVLLRFGRLDESKADLWSVQGRDPIRRLFVILLGF